MLECSDTWLADQCVPRTPKAQQQPTSRLKVEEVEAPRSPRQSRRGYRPSSASHASDAVIGGQNPGSIGGKQTSQSGRPQMQRLVGAPSPSLGTIAFMKILSRSSGL